MDNRYEKYYLVKFKVGHYEDHYCESELHKKFLFLPDAQSYLKRLTRISKNENAFNKFIDQSFFLDGGKCLRIFGIFEIEHKETQVE